MRDGEPLGNGSLLTAQSIEKFGWWTPILGSELLR